jgi:hypothetical protein
MSRGSVVGIEAGYGLDDQGVKFELIWAQEFNFSITSRQALGSTQPPIQWILGLFQWGWGGKAAGS